ncbi:hypothetical protein B7486_67440 [cyanobacterium TDX16]|nr:hypothetical protein B7486_67440 [cyanobacterium TDX16]
MRSRSRSHDDTDASELEHAVQAFAAMRPQLLDLARRALRSPDDAEDVVQEAWLRWQGCDRTRIRNPEAFLVTVTTRLALDAVRRAHVRHETSVGTWLPEPEALAAGPEVVVEHAEALDEAVVVLRARLSPREQEAFVLREAHGYPYRELAERLQLTEVHVRQIVSRAGRRLAPGQQAA